MAVKNEDTTDLLTQNSIRAGMVTPVPDGNDRLRKGKLRRRQSTKEIQNAVKLKKYTRKCKITNIRPSCM